MVFLLDNQLLASSVGEFAPPHARFHLLVPSGRRRHWSRVRYTLCGGRKRSVQNRYLNPAAVIALFW